MLVLHQDRSHMLIFVYARYGSVSFLLTAAAAVSWDQHHLVAALQPRLSFQSLMTSAWPLHGY